MNLGFDLDEVVVNLTKEIEEYLLVAYNIKWPINCFTVYGFHECVFSEDSELNKIIQKELQILVDDAEFQTTAEPIEGAMETLQALKRMGHKIYFISSRPKQNQPLTFRWLRQHGMPFDDLFVLGHGHNKGRYAKLLKLDMYIDDLESHLNDMYEYKKRFKKGLLLFDRPWNNKVIDGSKFKRVKNWQEILRHVDGHVR